MIKTMVQRVVSVTPDHIQRGVPLSQHRCPVALALHPVDVYADVKQTWTMLHLGAGGETFKHDDALRRWIYRFDFGEPVDPIDIAIDLENHQLWIC